MEKQKKEIEVGLTSADIQRMLDGEELIGFEDQKLRIFVKSWTPKGTAKIIPIK